MATRTRIKEVSSANFTVENRLYTAYKFDEYLDLSGIVRFAEGKHGHEMLDSERASTILQSPDAHVALGEIGLERGDPIFVRNNGSKVSGDYAGYITTFADSGKFYFVPYEGVPTASRVVILERTSHETVEPQDATTKPTPKAQLGRLLRDIRNSIPPPSKEVIRKVNC